ncbi:hypothetical protein [Streptomyces syringium]|uniref:Uncharacterized protein n=1 Tax=Streptomyces syringium TaxID=76729 RepID=A0ABS4XW35_9ACTN|nr:hypothetical protein [Streptomyces syringium]MBP2400721.1 hypothetical protein [Streptomyces syringium]
MNHRQRLVSSFAVFISTAALTLGTASVALASDAPSQAEGTAATVEKATGTTSIAPAPASGTTIPQRSTGDAKTIAATGDAVSIALPSNNNVIGTKAGKNTTVYPGAAKATDLAIQPTTDGGLRTLAVLKNATAPREQRYDIGLPDGARLVKLNTGAVAAVTKNGTFLGGFTTPWAKDATGNPIPTSYRIDGNALIQSVQTTDSTAFPVVADPKWVNDAAKGAAMGLATGCVSGAVAGGGAGCIPGAVAGGLGGAVAGVVGGLFD